jgi:hypothetical protein
VQIKEQKSKLQIKIQKDSGQRIKTFLGRCFFVAFSAKNRDLAAEPQQQKKIEKILKKVDALKAAVYNRY